MLYVITGQNFKQNRFLGSSGQKNTGKQPKNDNLKEQKHLKIENLRATDSISLKRAYMHHLTTFHLLKTEVSIDRGVGGGGGGGGGGGVGGDIQKSIKKYQKIIKTLTLISLSL